MRYDRSSNPRHALRCGALGHGSLSLSNLLLSSAVVLLDDPRGACWISNGTQSELLTKETLAVHGDSVPVCVVVDRRPLRQAQRLGLKPARCVALKDYKRLIEQAGYQGLSCLSRPSRKPS